MPGVTKHIYDRDIIDIQKEWGKQLKSIAKVLPCNYKKEDIIAMLKRFYPHEWKGVEYKKQYYDIKDRYIKKHKGKARYNMPNPERLLEKNQVFRNLLNNKNRKAYEESFSEDICKQEEKILYEKREKKIRRIDEKIEKAIAKTQTVTPDFLDKLIGMYSKKNATQVDRMYIIVELKKYYNPKIINFFFKCNDTELNNQLREIAFKHLQSFNYQPRLRKQKYIQIYTKNKKRKEYLRKIYPYETYHIPFNPEELEYRLLFGKEQKVKEYKYFISHSSSDAESVQKLIDFENEQGNLVFCDWINDSDYLKRSLLCESTLKVIEWRLQQSEAIIFVRSEKSVDSIWCQYELNYFYELGKPIYFIDKKDIENDFYRIERYPAKEYLNPQYKELLLIEENKIRNKVVK